MNNMFEGCLSLSSLNLSNFNISQNTNMEYMFYNCVNLEYINLKNLSELRNCHKMFDNVPENIVICINENIAKEKIFPQLNNKSCYSIDCSDDWNSKQKKIINKTNECIESCSRSEQYQFEYNGKCYENCTYGLFYEENRYIENKCKCELDKCLLCPKVPLNKNLCLKCNTNYYPKENDPLNLDGYINCYKDLEGYYLDNNLYKQCYYTCKACNISGDYIDHNCTECNDNYTIRFKHNNFFNCYYNCSNEEKECYENLTGIIEKEFRENYDTSILDIGQDDCIKTEKMTITFTTFQNQKNYINKSVSTIDLGECEKKIRNESNLSSNETLYIKKIDIFQEETKIQDVLYDVYYKSSEEKLIKLNLTICANCKITLHIPINITDNIDKYNINSGYYHDICYTTTSEDGTDLTLKDRKINYYDKYSGVCQKNCEFTGYNSLTGVAICTCNFKESSSSIVDVDFDNFDKKKLLESFKDIKNFLNFNILICYKNLLTKNGIIYNIGSYIIISIFLFHIISNITFSINQFRLDEKTIKKITSESYLSHPSIKTKKELKSNKDKSKGKLLYKDENIMKIKYNKKMTTSNIKMKRLRKETKKHIKLNHSKQIKNVKKFNKLKDEEINDLSYNLALIYDKRPLFEYYTSLLKTQHNLLCILFNSNDCISKLIKIDLFLIGFAIDYSIIALFYNDDTMHKIHERKGEFDFESQLPIMVYSFLITIILNIPLNFFAISDIELINLKQNMAKNVAMNREKSLKKKLIVKFSFYFIISFLLLVFIWYYISMFCVIYKNTQIHLLKDSISSFGISLFFPCGFYLLPGFFRIPALSDKKNKKKCLYEFSKFLQLLCEYV